MQQERELIKIEQVNRNDISRLPSKITVEEIKNERAKLIAKNLLLRAESAAEILAVSERTIFKLIEDGKLQAANEGLKNTGIATKGVRITFESLEQYRASIVV